MVSHRDTDASSNSGTSLIHRASVNSDDRRTTTHWGLR